jgi:hypothetical protein
VTGERPARPGEVCDCGRPAVVVFVTGRFGDVPYCGVPAADPDEISDEDLTAMAAAEREALRPPVPDPGS